MKISVALATYNGATYLDEQLQSIAAQTRCPDELVVCDDGSTDDTVAIVRRFAAAAPFDVRLEIGGQNLGAAGNFSRAVASCRGDVIALCDQDDVWLPHKLARLEQALDEDPRVAFVFSDAALIDADSRPLGRRLWETLGFRRKWQRQIAGPRGVELLVKRNLVTGATMAFRAAYRDMLLPIDGRWIHDAWFALLMAAVAPCRAIAEPLIQYRQHAAQQIGVVKKDFRSRLLQAARDGNRNLEIVADNCEAAERRLANHRSRLTNDSILRLLREKAEHYRTRSRLRTLSVQRLPMIVGELVQGHYARLSENWNALFQDLVLRSS